MKIYFLGTLHCNLTPHDELIKLIKSYEPSQLLVEITQKDLNNNRLEKYPDEMQAVVTWAKNNHIDIYGFDSDIKTLKEGVSDEDLKTLDTEQTAITSKHDWKEFNKSEFIEY